MTTAPKRPVALEQTARWLAAGIALVAAIAFASLGVQIVGLVGQDGLLPLREHLAEVARRFGPQAYLLFPTLFWFDARDTALVAACAVGVVAGLFAAVGRGARLAFGAMFVLYLSLFDAGQAFTAFQWDLLLLESLALAAVLLRRPVLFVWAARWLVFRFMFMSGLVKWLGDPTWSATTALAHHFATQPLPGPFAWWAARAPETVLRAGAGATLVVELVVPFFVFGPRPLRLAAAVVIAAFQLAIVATGNYGFFNVLAIVLCVALLDDAAVHRLGLDTVMTRVFRLSAVAPTRSGVIAARAFVVYAVVAGTLQIVQAARHPRAGDALEQWIDRTSMLRLVNRYGPFATMTTERIEIVVEVSDDGAQWRELAFRFKPGDTRMRPGWNVPHQPRLDWQMWFAAMGTQRENRWFATLMRGILRGTPEIVELLGPQPRGSKPPRFVRALVYEYRFADADERAAGQWWSRRQTGIYFPAMGLSADGETMEPAPPE
jgi:lipase maturation factor 1